MLKKFFLSLFIFLLCCSGCHKNSSSASTGVPNVAVNFTIDINLPAYVNLTVPGGWLVVSGGYRGILLYRATQDQFMAYDCTCTYNNTGYVKVEKSGLVAIDSSCGSTFTLLSGSPQHGPATVPLKQYQTYFDGTNLTVTN